MTLRAAKERLKRLYEEGGQHERKAPSTREAVPKGKERRGTPNVAQGGKGSSHRGIKGTYLGASSSPILKSQRSQWRTRGRLFLKEKGKLPCVSGRSYSHEQGAVQRERR